MWSRLGWKIITISIHEWAEFYSMDPDDPDSTDPLVTISPLIWQFTLELRSICGGRVCANYFWMLKSTNNKYII